MPDIPWQIIRFRWHNNGWKTVWCHLKNSPCWLFKRRWTVISCLSPTSPPPPPDENVSSYTCSLNLIWFVSQKCWFDTYEANLTWFAGRLGRLLLHHRQSSCSRLCLSNCAKCFFILFSFLSLRRVPRSWTLWNTHADEATAEMLRSVATSSSSKSLVRHNF